MNKLLISFLFVCFIGNVQAQSHRPQFYQQGEWTIYLGHNINGLLGRAGSLNELFKPDTRIGGGYTLKNKLVVGAFFHHYFSSFRGEYFSTWSGMACYYLNQRRLSPFVELSPGYFYQNNRIDPIPYDPFEIFDAGILDTRLGVNHRGNRLGVETSIGIKRYLRNPFTSALRWVTIQIAANIYIH